ncbi:zinc finger protein 227 [Anopheles ziemanni]|uniref:zinc finger protein 227 n=1 Tax=Anopheles coustani TaxID=139045 RepID=UPI00265B1296|nr:zinc finger protein 227 [Anopheles coustani]XP_058167178.1 zinc finger protein 227 [Anopheles ziemanni]
MGFSDSRSKMSDLNLLPKKHTNFSIERILLKPADGGSPSAASHAHHPSPSDLLEQKVDLTVKTSIKIVQAPATSQQSGNNNVTGVARYRTSACPATVTKNVPRALPRATETGTTPPMVTTPPPASPLLVGRPLNRVLDNPWCSRGPLMFDPKLTITGGPVGGPSCSTSGLRHSTANVSAGGPEDGLGLTTSSPGTSPISATSAASLVRAEVERKVVLSAYANNSVIERNRLSINYPYPVGLFNAYASAVAAATVSSVHYTQHNQQRLLAQTPSPAALLSSPAIASLQVQQQQHHHQQHHSARSAGLSAAALLAGTGPGPLATASAALFSSFYQLQPKSDENQNSIFEAHGGGTSADEASDGGTTEATSDGGKDSKADELMLHTHPLHHHHHHHHLHHHHEPGVAGGSGPGGGPLCSLMFPDCSYQCAICDKIFGNQDTLMTHEKSHKTPRFECEECGKGFSQLRNYKYHVSVHRGTKEFAAKCPECGKMFNDKGYLSSHLKIHRNKKEYSCPHCPKSFNQRVAFNMHVRIHTGVKPHKCNECGKRFSRKMLLKQHLRTHSGEKPYQCSVCGKSFADRSNMTLHHRLHSGIKPFACPICPKAFTKKHHLKTHLNYHTGYKPYKCPHPNCGQSFTQSSNMRTHAKKCQFKPPDSEFV